MTPDQWAELFKTVGVAAPLVGLLIYLLRQATEERREITNRFLAALENIGGNATRAIHENSVEMRGLAVMIEANRKSSVDEHARIVDSIGKLDLRSSHRNDA
jgi:hypothetical protein